MTELETTVWKFNHMNGSILQMDQRNIIAAFPLSSEKHLEAAYSYASSHVAC